MSDCSRCCHVGQDEVALFVADVVGRGAMADSLPPVSATPQSDAADFSPPPVPGFMLHQPAKPLTLDEMRRQADETARRVRPKRIIDAQPSSNRPTKTGK